MIKFIKKQITNMTKNWEENRMLSEVNGSKCSQDKNESVGISEPILSFIETFKNNHKRFKLEATRYNYSGQYTLTDKITKEVFEMYLDLSFCSSRYIGPSWMTDEEVAFVQNEIHSFYSSRGARLGELRIARTRKRLMGVYCK